MYNFGRRPPRALKSFGVAGLLGEECRIFYVPLFSNCNLGRVSDLLSARLKKVQIDEFLLRTLLHYSFFTAFRQAQESTEKEGAQPEPLTIECGVDSEKAAVGISFTCLEEQSSSFSKSISNVLAGTPSDGFEKLIFCLYQHSNRIVIRHAPKSNRVEIVSLWGTSGRMEDSVLNSEHQIELIALDEVDATPQPKAKEYVDLGDLDYSSLLKQSSLEKNTEPSPTGEVLFKAFHPDAVEKEKETRISGVTQNTSDEIFRVQGVTENLNDSTSRIVGGAGNSPPENAGISSSLENLYKEKITELQRKISDLTSRLQEKENRISSINVEDTRLSENEEDEELENTEEDKLEIENNGKNDGFLSKIWPFNKTDGDTAEEDLKPDNAGKKGAVNESELVLNYKKEAAGGSTGSEIQADINPFEETLKKAQLESVEIKKEISSARAKRWVDGLVGELVTERSRLQELSKKMNASARQKELEFKNKERALKEEIKKRDEFIRQKNFALSRAKEQVAQVNMNIEKMKTTIKKPSEDVHFKQKYLTLQKILAATKDENSQLSSKVEELRSQVNSAQYAAKVRGPSFNDFAALQGRLERTHRQLEELKKTNLHLSDKATAAKKERETTVGNMEEVRKRLEEMSKIVAASKDVEHKLKLKVEEMLQTELRLRKELDKVYGENKKLKANTG